MNTVAFWHVERTAGTSLSHTLRRAGITVEDSHAPYDVHGDITVTFLREPRSRLLSEFIFYWNLAHHEGQPIAADTLIEYVQKKPPVYRHVPGMDFVGLSEDMATSLAGLGDLLGVPLREYEDNRLIVWTPFHLGSTVRELRAALDEACDEDLALYRRTAGDRVPDPDEMLDYTLEKFCLTLERPAWRAG